MVKHAEELADQVGGEVRKGNCSRALTALGGAHNVLGRAAADRLSAREAAGGPLDVAFKEAERNVATGQREFDDACIRARILPEKCPQTSASKQMNGAKRRSRKPRR